MEPLKANELFGLEQYARERAEFRQRVLRHKIARRIAIGEHLALYFEDRLTVQYQIQEMLRIERLFEPAAIADELTTYNPLIPDGHNWKATCMIEYGDEQQRRVQLRRMRGIEDQIWVQIAQRDRVYAIADEDLPRSDAEKTSAVHFLRFELTAEMIEDLHHQADLYLGVNHTAYSHQTGPVAANSRLSLCRDLD